MEVQNLSVLRNELKYSITKEVASDLQCKFGKFLTPDEHSGTSGYMVRSLYFDSINNIDYLTKMAGIEIRKKIRLRVYSSDADFCKLEVKQKFGEREYKFGLWITRMDAYELTRLNYAVLSKYFADSQDAVYIYTLMTEGVYQPVVMIEYDRLAYFYPLNDTRITVDRNLRSSESCFDLFCKSPGYTVLLDEKDILEVKYNDKLLKSISDLLRPYDMVQLSISKYCLGRKVFCDFNF